MRLLLMVHAFPPRSTAGVEVYTLRLARALLQRGHEVRVLSAVHDLAAQPYAIRRRTHQGVDVIEVVNVHHKGTLETTYDDPDLDRAVAPVLRDFQPQAVHVQHLLNLSVGLLRTAREAGARIALTLHDYWLSCPRDGLRQREDLSLCVRLDHAICAGCLASSPYLVPALQRGLAGAARSAGLGRHLHRVHRLAPRLTGRLLGLLRRASPAASSLQSGMDRRAAALREALGQLDAVLAPTSFARDRGLEAGTPPGRTRVLPLGVLLEPPRERKAGPRPRLGFVGTLAPHKGAQVLIEAFRGITSPAASLALHGSEMVHPDHVAALRRAAAGDPRIHFRGPFAEGEQGRVLETIDLLVLPSVWWENSPLTVLEALGAGLPVIASRIGGVPELISGDRGLLVPPGDVAALRQALASAIVGDRLGAACQPAPLKTVAEHAAELEAVYAGT
jgi:glycosyltransferase involved in cell wall biosynthesis